MSFRNTRLIFNREVRDQLRDRRTLFMMLILPLLLYPAMGIGMVQMRLLFNEQQRTVVILGEDQLPDTPQLLQKDGIAPAWFNSRSDAQKLRVFREKDAIVADGEPPDEEIQNYLVQARLMQNKLLLRAAQRAQLDQLDERTAVIVGVEHLPDAWSFVGENGEFKSPFETNDETKKLRLLTAPESPAAAKTADPTQPQAEVPALRIAELISERRLALTASGDAAADRVKEIDDEIGQLLANGQTHAVAIIPVGFADNLRDLKKRFAENADAGDLDPGQVPRITMVYNKLSSKSVGAFGMLQHIAASLERVLIPSNLPLKPNAHVEVEVAPNEAALAEVERELEHARTIRRDMRLLDSELGDLLNESGIEVLVVIPEGLGEHVEEVNRMISEPDRNRAAFIEYEGPIILHNAANEKSLIPHQSVKNALDNWEKAILSRRLAKAELPASLPNPINATSVNVAKEEEIAASLWSKVFPALLIIMAVTGAFYPAVDVAAGEKERGTMETLLICPATRTEIVLGKFFTVMLFSVSTAVLNLSSMGFTGKYMVSIMTDAAPNMPGFGALTFPGGAQLAWIGVLLIPMAALFSALSLALATFARSSKEGQYYLTPLLMITMGITVFCLAPSVELDPGTQASWFYSVMPVVGVALLLKGILLNPAAGPEFYVFAIPVLITSICYSLLALWWAIEQFAREDVLFRESERFDLRLWVRHMLRDKEPTPSFAEAGFCFVMIMFLQFGAMKFMSQALHGVGPEHITMRLMQVLMVQQLVTIACPALFMGLLLTSSFRRTFRAYLPDWKMLGLAVLLPLALHVLVSTMVENIAPYFPGLPPEFSQVAASMQDRNLPIWLPLLAFAVTPGLCEELAFRGPILSGFNRSGRMWIAIMLSSIAFGAIHMVPLQVFYATLLGLVLGLFAVKSGSLVPCMVFHILFNSLQVLRSRVDPQVITDSDFLRFLVDVNRDGSFSYQWPTLILAALGALTGLLWLANYGKQQPSMSPGIPTEPTLTTAKPPVIG
ncbi:MAG: ABC transporter permease [Planctomycetota bacterium]|nr:ABC transporter permease [Planctomycetota bacterium]